MITEWAKPYIADGGIPCRSVMTFEPDSRGVVEMDVQFLEALLEEAGWHQIEPEPRGSSDQ